jgi:glycosyltransferase involved in cell wall biosynthesis
MPSTRSESTDEMQSRATNGPNPVVMHLRSSAGFWGPERVILDLAAGGPDRSVVVCFDDRRHAGTQLLARAQAAGAATATVRSRWAFDPVPVAGLLRLLRAHHADVVHAHDYKADAVATAACSLARVPVVATAHNWRHGTRALRIYARLDRVVLRRAAAVAAVSDDIAGALRRGGVRPDRVRVIHNGVDCRRFSPVGDRHSARAELGVPPDGPLLAACGRLSSEKGHALLLQAFARTLRDTPDARLAVAGAGELADDLARLAGDLAVAGRVHWLGRIERPLGLYRACDVYVQPSLQEGFPLTVLEAAACESAIVATAVGDVPRVIVAGETGHLVPPGDVDALATGIRTMLAVPASAARLASAARRRVVAEFDVGTMRAAYHRLYAAALSERAVA